MRSKLDKPQVHDFAVIWDEDHDDRIIQVIEAIYMAGLLSPIQFIGERKGTLTIILAAKFYFTGTKADTEEYRKDLQSVVDAILKGNDYWFVELGMFDRASGNPHQNNPKGIIQDDESRVAPYLKTIDSLWSLGTKDFKQNPISDS